MLETRIAASIVCSLTLLAGCGSPKDAAVCDRDPDYAPVTDPANFDAGAENPLWPLVAGTVTTFDGAETIEITVENETKVILGVTTTVIADRVFTDGVMVEDTTDWFATDDDGTVWYFGELSRNLAEGGTWDTTGSWEAGIDGALPGIVMPAVQPPVGEPYRQEYAPCEAVGKAETFTVNASVTVPYGTLTGCLITREFTAVEPGLEEFKTYCPGVGLTQEVDTEGALVQLIAVSTSGASALR